MPFQLMTFESRKLTQSNTKTPHHFMKKRIKFSEDYYEMSLARHGKRKEFGKRGGLEDLTASLEAPYTD